MLQAVSTPPSPTSTHHNHQAHLDATSLASLTSSLNDGRTHLLLAASGSVATIKLPKILSSLSKSYSPQKLSVRVLLTPSATRFLSGQSPEQPHWRRDLLSHGRGGRRGGKKEEEAEEEEEEEEYPILDAVYTDPDEWRSPGWTRGDGVLHIELRRWAHLLVVAPLSANTLAKIANGMADGLLTSVIRAWDAWGDLDAAVGGGGGGGQGDDGNKEKKLKRILVAPAMNTAMWRHPVTAKQLRVLEEEWGVAAGNNNNNNNNNSNNGVADGQKDGGSGGGGGGGGGGWFEVLRPIQKTLACGDVGDGAMVEYTQIVQAIEERLGLLDG